MSYKRRKDGKRIYGSWAGNPRGHSEDPNRCIVQVWPRRGGWAPYQCLRKRGHGPGGLFCKQHAKMVAEGHHLWLDKQDQELVREAQDGEGLL